MIATVNAIDTRKTCVRAVLFYFISIAMFGVGADRSRAEDAVHTYRSEHLVVHTDLAPQEVPVLLEQMEASLASMSVYWQRPMVAKIECFVVNDAVRWSRDRFPSRNALFVLGKINGFTESRALQRGRRKVIQSRVYTTMEPGVVQHELTHAYQDQVFGDVGIPLWYREGMAEVMSYHRPGQTHVMCRPEMIEYFSKSDQQREVKLILRDQNFVSAVSQSVARACREDGSKDGEVASASVWSDSDDSIFRAAREDYSWAWALCHLLYYNPNYQQQFAKYSRSFSTKSPLKFEEVFEDQLSQIEFELHQLVSEIEHGYEVELCAWDWKAKFEKLSDAQSVTCSVVANRGYQPTDVRVEEGVRYQYQAQGNWSTGKGAAEVSAGGSAAGAGQLVGIVVSRNKVLSTIELGEQGEFVSESTGRFYLRCQDDWGSLSDNHGKLTVQISR
jgi:hypothetical protein